MNTLATGNQEGFHREGTTAAHTQQVERHGVYSLSTGVVYINPEQHPVMGGSARKPVHADGI